MSAESAMSAMRPTLSGQASRLMIDAAVGEANATSVPVTVVVVDESGVTKEMLRMDQAPLVSVQTAINKAYAAAAIGMPPDDFYAAIESRRRRRGRVRDAAGVGSDRRWATAGRRRARRWRDRGGGRDDGRR